MPWKQDENGAVVSQDGQPVWVYEDGDNKGKEAPVDFGKTLTSIAKITQESIGRKDKLKEANGTLQLFVDAGIEDVGTFVTDGRAALETVANLSDKDILDAGEVDKIKAQATEVYDRKIENMTLTHSGEVATLNDTIAAKDGNIRNLIIKGAFDRSSFLKDKTVLPPEFAYSHFGNRFSVEEVDGELKGFGLDGEGKKLMSAKNPAEYADPEEAIELLIMSSPQKDTLLKMEANGSGNQGSGDVNTDNLLAQYNKAKEQKNTTAMITLKRKLSEAGYRGIL